MNYLNVDVNSLEYSNLTKEDKLMTVKTKIKNLFDDNNGKQIIVVYKGDKYQIPSDMKGRFYDLCIRERALEKRVKLNFSYDDNEKVEIEKKKRTFTEPSIKKTSYDELSLDGKIEFIEGTISSILEAPTDNKTIVVVDYNGEEKYIPFDLYGEYLGLTAVLNRLKYEKVNANVVIDSDSNKEIEKKCNYTEPSIKKTSYDELSLDGKIEFIEGKISSILEATTDNITVTPVFYNGERRNIPLDLLIDYVYLTEKLKTLQEEKVKKIDDEKLSDDAVEAEKLSDDVVICYDDSDLNDCDDEEKNSDRRVGKYIKGLLGGLLAIPVVKNIINMIKKKEVSGNPINEKNDRKRNLKVKVATFALVATTLFGLFIPSIGKKKTKSIDKLVSNSVSTKTTATDRDKIIVSRNTGEERINLKIVYPEEKNNVDSVKEDNTVDTKEENSTVDGVKERDNNIDNVKGDICISFDDVVTIDDNSYIYTNSYDAVDETNKLIPYYNGYYERDIMGVVYNLNGDIHTIYSSDPEAYVKAESLISQGAKEEAVLVTRSDLVYTGEYEGYYNIDNIKVKTKVR